MGVSKVHHCGRCGAFIDDGSERAWTGRHDAPKGQYRYQCNQCAPTYSVCEGCWDGLQAGAWSHGEHHTFEHVAPISTRHNTRRTGSGPWGNFAAGVSARSRERLRDRTGL